jgi:hypothetical protein
MPLDYKDIQCLEAALSGEPDTWKPWRGVYGRAQYLTTIGYLKRAGITAMPPHACYVISDEGKMALTIAAALKR